MATTEHTINDALAGLLRGTRYVWRDSQVIRSETTQMFAESRSRPDILVAEPHAAAVVIETEALPAPTVEAEAMSRLGETLGRHSGTVLSSIAIRLPQRFREAQGRRLKEAIKKANDLEFALYTGKSSENYTRHPQSGWISGNLADLSLLVQSASVPPSLIDEAANQLEVGVYRAAAWLEEMAANHPAAMQKIAAALHQQDSPQTRRMAAAILTNAFMFHEHLANGPGGLAQVRSLDELRGAASFTKSAILLEWQKILKVNYWSIFDISRRILEVMPAVRSIDLIDQLTRTAQVIVTHNLMQSHDLTGAVFQRLIADRKFLAAFYTTPASAALLVGLAVDAETLLADGDWSSPADVKSLRIADFACGTGTLLSTAYQRISQLHELHGGDSAKIHAAMMERALIGCDILPAATHLTASMLSGAHPKITYEGSAIFTSPYGLQEDGKIALGSIDLLKDKALLEGSQVTAKALEGAGEAEKDTWRFAAHGSFDMVIMNPPFTRANNHERRIPDTPNPNFAAFGSGAAEQKAMAKAAKRLTRGTIAHGSAGEASTFMALADRKLRIGGTLALVMPLTLLTGSSWEKCRTRLAEAYESLILISILGTDGGGVSFSADTGMGECLVIGRRNGHRQTRAAFVILNQAPDYAIYSITVAGQIRELIAANALRRLEDGPTGGSIIQFGDEIVGQAIDAPLPRSGSWKLARIADLTLAQSAYQLAARKRIWLPTQHQSKTSDIPMANVAQIGAIGPYHLDVSRRYSDGTRRPFELRPLQGDTVPTYPILSAHNADRERTMMFGADHDGIPYRAAAKEEQAAVDQRIADLFATASHCHSNLDFRFNSQSTAMQFTQRKTIGGTAWISIQLPEVAHEKALVLWANTTLGLLMFWWHSSKQQTGRGRLTKTTLQTLPVLDVTALDADQLEAAARLFDEMNQLPLRPLHELDRDENRKALDRRFYGAVLGLDDSLLADDGPLDILRQKLCREPSIRGRKK